MLRRTIQFASLILLATCAGTAEMPEAARVAMPTADAAWTFDSISAGLADASCPAGTAALPSVPLAITAQAIDLGPADDVARRLPEGAVFAGGWELTAENASFGGLSDLAVDTDGDLLAVVDDGAFVRIGMADGAPDGSGDLTYMLGEDGQLLQGKSMGDAEGLVVRNSLAIVSFERTHRISAFALETCGAAAREAPISPLP
ncbi:MAG: esterase-like activity of phytase family protein, partial [Hyphomonas sp.]|nr:esterase-like activity of phytase family protein [Hyphomonas sp.]